MGSVHSTGWGLSKATKHDVSQVEIGSETASQRNNSERRSEKFCLISNKIQTVSVTFFQTDGKESDGNPFVYGRFSVNASRHQVMSHHRDIKVSL